MSRTYQLLLLLVLAGIVRSDAAYKNVTDGPHSCGGVDVPYPFGIRDENGNGDFRDGFDLACQDGKPLLTTSVANMTIPIGNFSVKTSEVRVWLAVAWQCYNSSGVAASQYINIPGFRNGSAYRISYVKNNFFVLGCNTMGYLWSRPLPVAGGSNRTEVSTQLSGCMAYCENNQSAVSGVCSGVGCCHADIPPDLVGKSVRLTDIMDRTYSIKFSPCDYAFLAEKDHYTFHTDDLNMDLHLNPRLNPVTLNWAIRDNLTCQQAMEEKAYACRSNNSRCLNSTNGPGYICSCSDGYEGNPYVAHGCTDINECEDLDKYPCGGVCRNTQGSYKCTCDKHSHSPDPFTVHCMPNLSPKAKITIGTTVGVVVGVFIIGIIVLFWILAKEKRKMKEFFRKNGGPTLEKLNNIKLFTKEDIKKIRKISKYIGEGSFGKVYSGHIEGSNRAVAVKEPINGSSADKGQFVNEIIIQSQVIHKNIVKLIGCCLEVDVPILVYEFIPNGSLDDILHGDRKMPLQMLRRLKIAAESAEGLAYMHTKANSTIIHGDVKPANILLNDEFVPKISDFGISRLIVTDMQHTIHVIGDMSYMDPIFMQTGQLTKKSDVYSFGVVLLELITRRKASHSDKNNLIQTFKDAYIEDKSVDKLVDKDLAELDDPKLLHSLTAMIKQCLSLSVNQRPEMTDVAERLRNMVKRFNNKRNNDYMVMCRVTA